MDWLKDHIKETIKLALPVSIGQLGHIMMGVVDSLMVGHVGSTFLAASAIANGIFFLILVIGFGMTMAVTPLIAIARGAEDQDRCGVVVRQGLLVNVFFAFILILLIWWTSSLLPYFGQPADVTSASISYLNILSLSTIPFIIFQVYRQFLEGLSHVFPPMIIALAANIFNAFFNWILIFGKFGFKPMGLDGAGWSTFFTRFLMAVSIVLFVVISKKYKKYDPSFKFKSINIAVIKKIISIGLPSGLQYFLEVAAFAFSAIIIGWMGSVQLASHQIAINLSSITYMIILGISAAGTIRVGIAVGRNDIVETRRAGFSALITAGALMSLFGIVFIIFRSSLPSLYVEEKPVIELASNLLVIAAIFQIFDGLQATGLGVLRGLTDVKVPLLLTFASYWIIGIPIGLILGFSFNLGAVGIWIGLSAGLGSLAVTLVLRYKVKSKSKVII